MPQNDARRTAPIAWSFLACLSLVGTARSVVSDEAPKSSTTSLRGRVVWLDEAMKRRFGVETDPDAVHQSVALETAEGKIYPIIKDARGRGFLLDARWRDIDMELLVRRFEAAPLVQIIRVYTLKQGRKYELDYWCDICAIPMYELKECECCQGPIRIRERLVEDSKPESK